MVGMRRWTLAAATAALAVAVGAGTVLAADTAVTIANFAFDPTTVTINVGDSVTWTNQDSAAHTATAGDGSFDTGNIAAGGTATVTFDTAGTFAYHCKIHPTMNATVVVQGAAATPAPTLGGGVSITPAPTDTVAATTDAKDREALAVTLMLAGLGAVMLAGGFVADRRFRRRRDGDS